MAQEKLLAEWFWIDRWMGSSAFLLPLEARGLYREMLSQSWRRGAALPNNHEAIQRAVGATPKEWARTWPLIARFWRVDGDCLVNDTQLEVYADAQGRSSRAQARAQAGAQARHKQNGKQPTSTTQASAQALASVSVSVSDLRSPTPVADAEPRGGARGAPTARSKRPIFTGQRLTVFEWQLDNLSRMLGSHTDDFDLHEWFFTLDGEAAKSGAVIPQRDGGAWLLDQTLAEAARRGLPIAVDSGRKHSKTASNVSELQQFVERHRE